MEPYRIKHKAIGLYYKPGKPNLSKIGKVYITGNNILSYNKVRDFVDIIVTKESLKRDLEALNYNYDYGWAHECTFKIPKSEFEIEYITYDNKGKMSYNESLKSNSNYPAMSQSEWDKAPWNQEELPEKEIEVTVSVTLSKTVKVKVSDYEITDSGKDEDGQYFEDIDYSNCDLKKAVEEQIILPQNAYKSIMTNTKRSKKAYEDIKDWNVDDYEIVLD